MGLVRRVESSARPFAGRFEKTRSGYGVGVPLLRLFTFVLMLYRMYRRLPKSQRRQLVDAVGRYGPRVAETAARRVRTRR